MTSERLGSRGLTRVLLADDQALFRRGISSVLRGESDIDVVSEADSGSAAVERAVDLVPDVVLMDVRMPGVNGIDAARAIKVACPSTSILMLTISDEEEDLYEAIKAGASGYLLKEVSVATVAGAIRSVMQGESFLSPSMASKLLLEFNALSQRQETSFSPLSDHEVEVLRHVALGHPNDKIAAELGVDESTVNHHVRNVLEKLHLQDRVAAAMFAVQNRLVSAEDVQSVPL